MMLWSVCEYTILAAATLLQLLQERRVEDAQLLLSGIAQTVLTMPGTRNAHSTALCAALQTAHRPHELANAEQ